MTVLGRHRSILLCHWNGSCNGLIGASKKDGDINVRTRGSTVSSSHQDKNRMSETFPVVYLARHGETAWTITGQRTGLIDLPLTERGECNARRLRQRLSGLMFAKVFASPLQRVMRTCELAGFGSVAQIDCDLVEGDYGEYEGRPTAEILAERPLLQLVCGASPGGQLPQQGATRAHPLVGRLRPGAGNSLLFS